MKDSRSNFKTHASSRRPSGFRDVKPSRMGFEMPSRRAAMCWVTLVAGLLLFQGCRKADDDTGTGPELDSGSPSASTSTGDRPQPSANGPWPSAVAETTDYDFGRAQIGEEMEHIFVISNDGDATLNLQAGEPTCKCTEFRLSKLQIAPGDKSELIVRWKGKVRDPGFHHGGPVYTDDPRNSTMSFYVSGIVESAVEILPTDVWNVGTIENGKPGVIDGQIISRVYPDMTVTNVQSESPLMQADLNQMTKAELRTHEAVQGYKLALSVSPDVPTGVFESKVTFDISCVEDPVSVVVKGKRDGPIKIQPAPGVIWVDSANGLKMGQFPATKGRKADLILLVNEEQLDGDLQLVNIKSTPRYLQTELTPLGKGGDHTGRYRLTITVPPGVPVTNRDRTNQAKLELTTNHPGEEMLKLNITFRTF